jgi:phytoene dehydrogenase-like protein
MDRGKVERLLYDAAIIGAGAEGLAAAATLARAGRKVVVLEQSDRTGGRCVTREFHPGFRSSPYCDELLPIPAEIFWSLDLARRGAILVPSGNVTALWSDRAATIARRDLPPLARGAQTAADALRRAGTNAPSAKSWFFMNGRPLTTPAWPGDEWATASLAGVLGAGMMSRDSEALAMACALSGGAAQPDHGGSALHLLTSASSGLVAGGLQQLGEALADVAQEAGVEILCGLEVTDINQENGKVQGARLADGSDILARAVLSTLDLKRTFLSLFSWNDLPKPMANRVANFRMAGRTARLLFALDRRPESPASSDDGIFRGPIFAAPCAEEFADAYAAWRSGTLPENLPLMLRFDFDPRMCPAGAAIMTVTAGYIPARFFDGAWTHQKRDALRDQVLAQIEKVLPGVSDRIIGSEILVPPDMEEDLGCTDGDLWGGEIAADQMLGFRPWLGEDACRTQIGGLYLAGGSTAAGVLGSCASGVIAAGAIDTDLKSGHLK